MRAVLLLFWGFLFSSCQTSRWTYSSIHTGQPIYDGKRLTYQVKDPINEPELEFLKTQESILCFCNLLQHYVLSTEENVQTKALQVKTGKEHRIFYAKNLAGGQRLKISEKDTKWLLQKLLNQEFVFIEAPGSFKLVVDPNKFKRYYKKINKDYNALISNKLIDLAL
ncbi:MAG: hypothetical protein Tsb0015_08710 [Simkaniaceae bacterium]